MNFVGSPETERAISQTVGALLACPKNRENSLIRKLRNLWNRRLTEIAVAERRIANIHSTQTTGPTPATEASSLVPTASATATTSTAVMDAASETTSPCGGASE